MGHKVHPTGFRLGVVKGWQSRWFAERDYKDILAEDFLIRKLINKELSNASVSKIEIERTAADQVLVKVHTAKPGIVIGKSGEKVERLRGLLEARTKKRRVRMDIVEIRNPELDAVLVSRGIAEQLEKRVSFRRAMKQAVQKSMRANAKGIKVIVGGRLGGAEIARTEKEVEGSVPLQTLRADIDYGQAEAHTTFGVIGIKVWIYRGDILPSKRREPGEPIEIVPQPTTFAPREDRGRGGDRDRRGGPGGGRGGDRDRRGGPGGGRGGERGDRAPRPPRPQGEGGVPPRGDRAPRPPRPQGEGGAPPRGDRAPRPPRPQGEGGAPPRGERAPRPPRPQGEGGPPREPRPQTPPVSEQAAPAPTQAPDTSSVDKSGASENTQSE